MKFLLVAKQERNVATFITTLRHLLERGHDVTLALQERDEARDRRIEAEVASERFRVVPCPPDRIDPWADRAALLRRLGDCLRFVRSPFDEARALRTRVFQRFREEIDGRFDADALAAAVRTLPDAQIERLESVLRLAEDGLPTSPLFDEFITSHRPDALLITPLVHFGSAQADLAASGRRLGIPVWMLLFSWDNLSTKGSLHVHPDLMFVWNERQRDEAEALHGFPPERVVIAGAPRFDEFFALAPLFGRDEFHRSLGLDPARPTLLYLCSSKLVAPRELEFVQQWLAAIRGSSSSALRDCNVVLRPHPDIDLLPDEGAYVKHEWPAHRDLRAQVARPFDDPRALVLRTSPRDPRGLYESLVHSTAVVGLNTTAELEAGIVGRPVFTVKPGDDAGQRETVHFHYLTREHGGFVSVAPNLDQHVGQLAAALAGDVDVPAIRRFIETFLRPLGIDRAVAPLLATALEQRVPARTNLDQTPVVDAASPEVRIRPVAADGSADPEPPVVPLAYRHGRVVMRAAPEAEVRMVQGAVAVDRGAIKWLRQRVRVGDVVYDMHAGAGVYSLIAASQRGAVVVAFEPGYQVFRELCENVRLNGCQASVMAIPLALGDRDGLTELRYRGAPGGRQHELQHRVWRPRPAAAGAPYTQPAVIARLDSVVQQHDLPRPNHVRITAAAVAAGVLDGAVRTLTDPALRSLWIDVALDEQAAVVQRLEALGLRGSVGSTSKRSVQMIFSPAAAAAAR